MIRSFYCEMFCFNFLRHGYWEFSLDKVICQHFLLSGVSWTFSLEVIKPSEVLYNEVTDEGSVLFEEEKDWQKAKKCARPAWLAWLQLRSPQCRYRLSWRGFLCAQLCAASQNNRGEQNSASVCICSHIFYSLFVLLWGRVVLCSFSLHVI